jgi:hypothetical protein
MATIDKYTTKRYDKPFNLRQRTLRFLQDNTDTFSDHPNNTQYLIDREDIHLLNYYSHDFADKCFYIGLTSTFITGLAVAIISRKTPIRGAYLSLHVLCFVPIMASTGVHYWKFSQFIDYCSKKYESKGLWDDELWDYHKARTTKSLEKSYKIGK